jgi:hypothetical protein
MSDIRTVGHGLSQPAALQLKLPEPSHLVKSEPAELGSRQRWSVASATPTARMAPATGQPCDALASPWAAACPRSPQDGVASSARLLLTSSADTTHGTRHMAPDTWRQVQEAVQYILRADKGFDIRRNVRGNVEHPCASILRATW